MTLPTTITIGPNNKVYDINAEFPAIDNPQRVIVQMSGGVESTIVAYIAAQKYGAENIIRVTAIMGGRRSWEVENARMIAQQIGISRSIEIQDERITNLNHHQHALLRRAVEAELQIDLAEWNAWFTGVSWPLNHSTRPGNAEDMKLRSAAARIYMPLSDISKAEAIDMYYELGVVPLLALTHSCTESNVPCGSCYCCLERRDGFALAGVTDPAAG